jgi:acyl-CoA ligase (AMP-forming) (exosortase A-associated)
MMPDSLHRLLLDTATLHPDRPALELGKQSLRYTDLARDVCAVTAGLVASGLARQERVAIYLPKQFENVVGMFATAAAGGIFVPVNPALKAPQVEHILNDCDVRVLITTSARATALQPVLGRCAALRTIVLTDVATEDAASLAEPTRAPQQQWLGWDALLGQGDSGLRTAHRIIDRDVAAILYTSGSTGKPKGVVLSHHNMVAGAHSVASYLGNIEEDRLLAVLPFSFDYGFSQLSTAFSTGACVVLLDYLLPRDVVRSVARHRISGLAAVPPLWIQLAALDWPEEAATTLRYITNSGGAMPRATLSSLRTRLPRTDVFLMYGLTEAFRSTYLPPDQVDIRPDSMGRAIPNAEVMVLRPDGTRCAPDEPGELVHRGALVSLGYWNDPERTAARFRPLPSHEGSPLPELAVWSGDTVRADAEGYLYFVGRQDDMIKTSGYRVSPAEVEEEAYASGVVGEAAALGVPHPQLGAAIVLVCAPLDGGADSEVEATEAALQKHLRARLPTFMQPARIEWTDSLPRNPNGKLDRTALSATYRHLFEAQT